MAHMFQPHGCRKATGKNPEHCVQTAAVTLFARKTTPIIPNAISFPALVAPTLLHLAAPLWHQAVLCRLRRKRNWYGQFHVHCCSAHPF